MKLHIGGVSLFLALSGLPSGVANALDTGVQNLSILQQESTCKGVVKDDKGETIIGASVLVKGTTNGTITDLDGKFNLSNVISVPLKSGQININQTIPEKGKN